ncbi:MAG TPA: hypothetical protein DCZ55_34595 [Cyanobacteria bacterium UBA11371]|nr:hypothetical protein [Cyanobacteria bacterium UBA11371]HBE32475.1 hypothetical protein [Cyanobacteria bacterium UBA11368]
MSILPNFFRSLLLTSIFSFATPILLVGGMLGGSFLVRYIPGLQIIGQSGADCIWQFLAIFGSGSPSEGILAIAFTFGLVGVLFDTYAFYRYQTLRGN